MKEYNLKVSVFTIGIIIIVMSCTTHNTPSPIKKESITNSNSGVLIKVDSDELLRLLKYDKSVFIIDVQTKNNRARSCKRMPVDLDVNNQSMLPSIDTLPVYLSIIVLTKNGVDENQIANYLINKGFTVYFLDGGMDAYWESRKIFIRDKLNLGDKKIDVIELYADDFGC